MRKLLLCTAIALLAAGCKDGGGTSSGVATSVSVSPGTVSLNALGATQVVRAAVADQNGKAMRGAALAWSSSSAAVTVAGAGGDSAIVTAVGNGTASITATSGSASGAASVAVAQAASSTQKGGDGQTAAAGTALPQPVVVGVRDRLGQPVAGVNVSFIPVGGGSVTPASATTGGDGNASVTWTLGTAAGSTQQLLGTVAGVGDLQFTATAVAGPAATATAAAGNNQTAARSAAVVTAPRVLVRDAFNNPVAGAAVEFAVTSGGGTATGGSQITDSNGGAAVGGWTLGSALGANTLTATFPGTAVPPVVFTATAANAGTVTIQAGNNQGALAGTAVPTAPRVLVRDGDGNPMAGVEVTFAVTAGGGSVGTGSVTTNASGVASAGSWTLGPQAGPNTLTASVAGITGAPAAFRGIGCTGSGGSGYAMTLCFTTAMTATQRAAFQNAAARWSGVITADLPDIPMSVPTEDCGDGSPSINMNVDDLLIFAGAVTIDGPSGILGQAGWCYRRTGGLPVVGVMQFDVADMNGMEADGSLNSVILHEMGHVLGIGTLWGAMGFLQNPSSGGSPLPDTYFSGPQAIIGFDAVGGTGYTGGQKVPVENAYGPGTRNGHWRESVLGRELMTGIINTGANPLSVLTVRSLTDLGYTVDVAAADAFSLTFALHGPTPSAGRLRMMDDLYRGPRFTVDRHGRRTRVRD